METFTISAARQKWGALCRAAQRDEVPFTLRLRHDPACVAAPNRWFKRACRGLDPAPEVQSSFETHDDQRQKLARLVEPVLADGAFVSVTRLEGRALVLVPIDWYEERVAAIGPPAGDLPEPEKEPDGGGQDPAGT
jgi:hypothetical protein